MSFQGVINVKNRESSTQFIEYDGTQGVWQHLGNISGELNKLVGGNGIQVSSRADDLTALLGELTTGKRADKNFGESDVAGVSGVELLSVTSDSITFQFQGGDGTYDTLVVAGEGVSEIISAFDASTKDVDLKGRNSEFEVFTYDDYSQNFRAHVGGTSGEFRDIVGGAINQQWGSKRVRDEEGNWVQESYLKSNDLDDLFQEFVLSDARPTSISTDEQIVGVNGFTLVSLTDDTFVLEAKGWSGTRDTLVFTGEGIAQVIENAGEDRIDVKGWKSDFAIFDFDSDTQMALGDTSGELKDLVGHKIDVKPGVNDIESILTALVHSKNEAPGINGVSLLGMDQDSFSIQIEGWSTDHGTMVDTILFTNVEEIIQVVLVGVPETTGSDMLLDG